MPELEEWVAQAEELFPDSFYTQIDIMGLIARRSWQKGDYADCLRRSERYLSAMKDFRSGKGKRWDLTCSTVSLSIPDWEMRIRYVLARSCIKEKMPGRALELLDKLDPEIVREILASAQEIQTTTDDGTALVVMKLLERIRSAGPDAEGLEAVFAQAASAAFSEEQRKKDENSHAVRPAYTLYLPLAGKCEAGTAAAVIEAKSVPEMEKLLGNAAKAPFIRDTFQYLQKVNHFLQIGIPELYHSFLTNFNEENVVEWMFKLNLLSLIAPNYEDVPAYLSRFYQATGDNFSLRKLFVEQSGQGTNS